MAIRAEDVNNLPLNNAVSTIVQGADTHNIDTVIVGGTVRKWRGELVGLDLARLRTLAYESRDYLARRAGFGISPIRPVPRLEIQDAYLRDYFAAREQA